MYKLKDIQGIGSAYAAKLLEAGLKTTDQLLEAAKTRKGRAELAEKLGLGERAVLEWANRADLMRIKGVAGQFSDLLERAGVDSALELARRVPDNLHAKLVEINTEHKLVRRVPTLEQVKKWVEYAKELPRAIEH